MWTVVLNLNPGHGVIGRVVDAVRTCSNFQMTGIAPKEEDYLELVQYELRVFNLECWENEHCVRTASYFSLRAIPSFRLPLSSTHSILQLHLYLSTDDPKAANRPYFRELEYISLSLLFSSSLCLPQPQGHFQSRVEVGKGCQPPAFYGR